MTRKQIFQAVMTAGFFGWFVPASLWAQVPVNPGTAVYATVTPAELKEQAEELFSVPARFGEAAELLEQAARLTPVEEVAGVTLLVKAARIHFYAGQLERARGNMKEAGWRALGNGELVAAANAYVDAALIAVQQDDRQEALELVQIVKLLAQWPKVTFPQRREILKRIA